MGFEIYPSVSRRIGQVLEFFHLELGICQLAAAMEFENIKLLPSYPVARTSLSGKRLAVRPSADGWQTPDAPNNIIHVRLATGSVVEQMDAHPFAKLHTALTHNGETTNYAALKQRVEQFNSKMAGIMFVSYVRCSLSIVCCANKRYGINSDFVG